MRLNNSLHVALVGRCALPVVLLAVPLSGRAQAPAAPPGNAPPEQEGLSEKILRDPFWPVGYTPATPEDEQEREQEQQKAADEEVKQRVPWPNLKLKGITRTAEGKHLAILEGTGLVEEGDTVTRRVGNIIFVWKINEISEKGVSYTKLDARIAGQTDE